MTIMKIIDYMDISSELNIAMLGLIKLDQEIGYRSEAFDEAWNAICHANDKLKEAMKN